MWRVDVTLTQWCGFEMRGQNADFTRNEFIADLL